MNNYINEITRNSLDELIENYKDKKMNEKSIEFYCKLIDVYNKSLECTQEEINIALVSFTLFVKDKRGMRNIF